MRVFNGSTKWPLVSFKETCFWTVWQVLFGKKQKIWNWEFWINGYCWVCSVKQPCRKRSRLPVLALPPPGRIGIHSPNTEFGAWRQSPPELLALSEQVSTGDEVQKKKLMPRLTEVHSCLSKATESCLWLSLLITLSQHFLKGLRTQDSESITCKLKRALAKILDSFAAFALFSVSALDTPFSSSHSSFRHMYNWWAGGWRRGLSCCPLLWSWSQGLRIEHCDRLLAQWGVSSSPGSCVLSLK